MNKFYVLLSLFLVVPFVAGNGKGGAGPSGDPKKDAVTRREAAEKSMKEGRCPRCVKETSEGNRAYCMVQNGKHHKKCGDWVCGKCRDEMYSNAFWTNSKKHTMTCPVCHQKVTDFVDTQGRSYDANAATGYAGF